MFFGDGAGQAGAFRESLNIASLWRLPVIFVCENNWLRRVYAALLPHISSSALRATQRHTRFRAPPWMATICWRCARP